MKPRLLFIVALGLLAVAGLFFGARVVIGLDCGECQRSISKVVDYTLVTKTCSEEVCSEHSIGDCKTCSVPDGEDCSYKCFWKWKGRCIEGDIVCQPKYKTVTDCGRCGEYKVRSCRTHYYDCPETIPVIETRCDPIPGCVKQPPPETRPVCGKYGCEPGENNSSCPQDCPPQETRPVCGKYGCERSLGENESNCPKDCPKTSAPPTGYGSKPEVCKEQVLPYYGGCDLITPRAAEFSVVFGGGPRCREESKRLSITNFQSLGEREVTAVAEDGTVCTITINVSVESYDKNGNPIFKVQIADKQPSATGPSGARPSANGGPSPAPLTSSISDVDLKFNSSDGPVNLDGVQSGTLSWSVGSFRSGTPSCFASCEYTNSGETVSCNEFRGSQPTSGSLTTSPKTTLKYTIGCTNGNTVYDSVIVKVMRYRCLFGICQGSWKNPIQYFKYDTKALCTQSCRSVLPER